MFNRYWRSYPWALRLALAMLLVFTLFSFSVYLTLIIGPMIAGVKANELVLISEKSPRGVIQTSVSMQAIRSFGTYVLPAILFAIFTHPRPRAYLGIRKPGSGWHWLLVCGIAVGMIPAIQVAQQWFIAHVDLGASSDKDQTMSDAIVGAWMSLRGPGMLPLLVTFLALLPALGEELLFRGVFLRLFHQYFSRRGGLFSAAGAAPAQPDSARSMLLPVIVTSIIFTYLHAAPYSYLFIFFAGCVLALIYQLTGSLLCSILAHFIYNGAQVLATYVGFPDKGADLPAWTGLAGLVLFLLCFYGLVRTQTPLRANWSADFAPGEAPQQPV